MGPSAATCPLLQRRGSGGARSCRNSPFLNPKRCFTLPLDINLNKDYAYQYVGRDKVGGIRLLRRGFQADRSHKTLYQGRAWIETRTFAPVKTSTVQTNLSAPVVSNEENDVFSPRVGQDCMPLDARQDPVGGAVGPASGENTFVFLV